MSENFTISQALRRIKKLKGELAEYQDLAQMSSSWELSNLPVYGFSHLVNKMDEVRMQLLDLESRVAVANATNMIKIDEDKDMTLTALIRELQELKGQIAWYRGINLRSGVVKNRETEWDENKDRSVIRTVEVTYVAAMTEIQRNDLCKKLQDRFKDLNNKLEDANHKLVV